MVLITYNAHDAFLSIAIYPRSFQFKEDTSVYFSCTVAQPVGLLDTFQVSLQF